MSAEDSLSESFRAVARELRSRSMRSLAPWDISPSQSRALAVLMSEDPPRLSELSERLRIAARSATEVVDALEERGLARRAPDPSDRRATRVELTEAGERVSAAVSAARATGGEQFFAALDDADRAALARILRKLLDEPPS